MIRKASRKTAGFFTLGFGIVFGILPLVPGILLIIIGLELLGIREVVFNKVRRFLRLSVPVTTPKPIVEA